MMNCDEARALLALHTESEISDAALRDHLASCPACAIYHRRNRIIDATLREELRWEVPPVLTAQLMAIALQASHLAPVSRPRRWYILTVYLLTAMVMAVSLAVAWTYSGPLLMQIGLGDALEWMFDIPAQWLAQVTQTQPDSQRIIEAALWVRDQLLWLLLATILWALLDRSPQSLVAKSE
ncbi:MAG: zf-HC2 domain-containing protein [Roseiflexus sp.]|nr:zf-HC2 domain-containing protein [Roseiflexus sp.]MCS7288846.1 zf-HC2 domain-containing protein [Roseiflexus sp.]MDW8234077.1 anti-sigma factor [Roseiflexaceae bacterium]